jgi:hypothetical protein
MEQSELLRYFTTGLEHLGLRYFVTGSVATIFFGEPRFTNDIDIVGRRGEAGPREKAHESRAAATKSTY